MRKTKSIVPSENFSRITFIMFTRNRYSKAKNVIEFWTTKGAKVLVLDASDENQLEKVSRDIESITYFSAKSFHERAVFASSHVETEYSLIHSDDSLVLPSGVDKAINFMDKNKNWSYTYSTGNFTKWYVELTSRKLPSCYHGFTPTQRILGWSNKPSDAMWGAVWRSRELCISLQCMGESISVFPVETALNTLSLYLAGAAFGEGVKAKETIHLSRHWNAPIDSSLRELRFSNNPYGIELNSKNSNLIQLWKLHLLESINNKISEKEKIRLYDLDLALKHYWEHEPNLGEKSKKRPKYARRIKEKFIIITKNQENSKHRNKVYSSVLNWSFSLYMHFWLFQNLLFRKRISWRSSKLIKQFEEEDCIKFGLSSQYFRRIGSIAYKRIFENDEK